MWSVLERARERLSGEFRGRPQCAQHQRGAGGRRSGAGAPGRARGRERKGHGAHHGCC